MRQITKNIWEHELKCKCGKCDVRIQDHENIIQVVQFACDHFADIYKVKKVDLVITSAARCREHNLTVGSNDESQHIRCNAMDIRLFSGGKQIGTERVSDYLKSRYNFKFGIGHYVTFTHIDTRTKKSRW